MAMPMIPKNTAAMDPGCGVPCADLSVSGGCPGCPDKGDRPTRGAGPACSALCAGMTAIAPVQTIPDFRPDGPFRLLANPPALGRVVTPERSPPRPTIFA